ncbi:hypothetical protein [Chitinophaga qingshengii]|uniref:DUF4345 domain-containing protein n=1 Tax=Chitinophaga qingshengii TaxID=1569794 RepID=A0ABR7TG45_9BACT|nr:hypothetical protein [Chitinophaga qingshengii]MBC9928863.1 hypothetical protein [Chitinophaga qingshengii]
MRAISKPTAYTIIAGCGAAILAFLYVTYHRFNPFYLAGREFLVFYSVLILVTLVNIRLLRQQYLRLASQVNLFCLLLGISRFIQGAYHHKPVGYLTLLLIFPITMAFRLRASAQR